MKRRNPEKRLKKMRAILWTGLIGLGLLVAIGSGPALAGKADVIDVKVKAEAGDTYTFDVTVKSDDTGWDKYADRWEIMAPDGTMIASRVLLHPHETEQPFTRGLSGVKIPDGVKTVMIRAHDLVEGYGGREMSVTLPGR